MEILNCWVEGPYWPMATASKKIELEKEKCNKYMFEAGPRTSGSAYAFPYGKSSNCLEFCARKCQGAMLPP